MKQIWWLLFCQPLFLCNISMLPSGRLRPELSFSFFAISANHASFQNCQEIISSSRRNEYYLGGIIALLLQDHCTMSTKSVCSSQYIVRSHQEMTIICSLHLFFIFAIHWSRFLFFAYSDYKVTIGDSLCPLQLIASWQYILDDHDSRYSAELFANLIKLFALDFGHIFSALAYRPVNNRTLSAD